MNEETIPKEQYLRLAADFDNYRKQEGQRIQEGVDYEKIKLVLRLVIVLDDLALTVQSMPKDLNTNFPKWADGFTSVMHQFEEALRAEGVAIMENQTGKQFNPETMEAVQMKPPNRPEDSGTVESEVRAGYTMHGKVIRPERVIIYQ